MRIRSVLTSAALVAALTVPFAPAALADHPGHCTRYVGGTQGTPKVPTPAQVAVITVPTPQATFYVEARQIATEQSGFSIWVYEETNSISGLQRGSDARQGRLGLALAPLEGLIGTFVDPCRESANPDQAVF